MTYVSEALEKQIESLAYLQICYEKPHLRRGASPGERNQWITDIHALHRAAPFYWNARTVALVNATLDAFKLEDIECSRELLYNDVAWHWFGEAAPFDIRLITGELMPVRAITWYLFNSKNRPYIGATAWCNSAVVRATGEPTGFIGPTIWASVFVGDPMATQISDDELSWQGFVDDRTTKEAARLRQWIVAASTFLRQELLTVQHEPCERHARKRLRLTEPKDINVVQLRRARHVVPSEATEHHDVGWSWQWIVRAHVRQQWYGTLGKHLPVLIHPYLKGPEDKPLKPRTTPIYSVTR